MGEQVGTEIYARYKQEPKEVIEESDHDSSDEEPPLTFKVRKDSAQLTRTILEQFNHLNTEDPMCESSKSRKNSASSDTFDSSFTGHTSEPFPLWVVFRIKALFMWLCESH